MWDNPTYKLGGIDFTDGIEKCPLKNCEGEAWLNQSWDEEIDFYGGFNIYCRKCGLRTADYETIEEVKKHWNSR